MKHTDKILIYLTILTGQKYHETSHYLLRTYHTYAPVTKEYAVAVVYRIRRTVVVMTEWYDKKFPQAVECSGNIMCERTGLRHKDGCLGRVEPFNTYARGIK